MSEKKNVEVDKDYKVNTQFCPRCGSLYYRVFVTDDTIMPYCPVCHMEIEKYFIDKDNKFIHFGDIDYFAKIMEKLEHNTDKIGFRKYEFLEKAHDKALTFDEFVKQIVKRSKTRKIIDKKWLKKQVA